jgi:hypothetical protein
MATATQFMIRNSWLDNAGHQTASHIITILRIQSHFHGLLHFWVAYSNNKNWRTILEQLKYNIPSLILKFFLNTWTRILCRIYLFWYTILYRISAVNRPREGVSAFDSRHSKRFSIFQRYRANLVPPASDSPDTGGCFHEVKRPGARGWHLTSI